MMARVGLGDIESGRNEHLLVLAIVAMIASFAVAQWSGHAVARQIHDRAESLYADEAPSIASLAALRLELKSLQVATIRHADDGVIRAIDRRIAAELGRYDALPPLFDGDTPSKRLIHQYVDRVHRIVDRGVADDADARAALDRALSGGIAATTNAIDLCARNIQHVASEIDAIRRRAETVSTIFFALSTALAFVTAILLARMFQRARLASERLRGLQERRADELERFAGRIAHDIMSPLTTTMMAVGVALGAAPEGSPVHKALDRGKRGLVQARSIVSDLYEFARSGAKVKVAPANLGGWCARSSRRRRPTQRRPG
jgi:signal transduction histidine kinase